MDVVGRGGRWMRESIDAVPATTLPWTNPWKCTLAGILIRRPASPLLDAGPLGILDRFGALHLDGTQVGFDGEPHEWDRVTGVRTCSAIELLTNDALEREVDRIRHLLPPVPGRKKLMMYVAEHLTLVLYTALDQSEAALHREIVAEVRYRGPVPGARRVARPGLFAAALLSLRPDANEALIGEATRREIPVASR
ncbi:hypothetical protein [Actinospica acidithermotolerans]|nr:hypothetical protein [Actinospica acidithermotolerans]